jgi:hypothetical protein
VTDPLLDPHAGAREALLRLAAAEAQAAGLRTLVRTVKALVGVESIIVGTLLLAGQSALAGFLDPWGATMLVGVVLTVGGAAMVVAAIRLLDWVRVAAALALAAANLGIALAVAVDGISGSGVVVYAFAGALVLLLAFPWHVAPQPAERRGRG